MDRLRRRLGGWRVTPRGIAAAVMALALVASGAALVPWSYAGAIFSQESALQILAVLSGVIGGAMLLLGMALRRRGAGRWSRAVSLLSLALLLAALALFASAWAARALDPSSSFYSDNVLREPGGPGRLGYLSERISSIWFIALVALPTIILCGSALLLGYLPMIILRRPGPARRRVVAVCAIALAAAMAGHFLIVLLGLYPSLDLEYGPFGNPDWDAGWLFIAVLLALILLGCLLGAAAHKPAGWLLLLWLRNALWGAPLATAVFLLPFALAYAFGLLAVTFVLDEPLLNSGRHLLRDAAAGVAIATSVAAFAFALVAFIASRVCLGNAAKRVLHEHGMARWGLWLVPAVWGFAAIMLSWPFAFASDPVPVYPFLDHEFPFIRDRVTEPFVLPRSGYIFITLMAAAGVAVMALAALPTLIVLKIRRGRNWAWVLRPYWAAAPLAVALVAFVPLAASAASHLAYTGTNVYSLD